MQTTTITAKDVKDGCYVGGEAVAYGDVSELGMPADAKVEAA